MEALNPRLALAGGGVASLTGTQADGGLGFMALAGALRTGGRHLGAHFFFFGAGYDNQVYPPTPPSRQQGPLLPTVTLPLG